MSRQRPIGAFLSSVAAFLFVLFATQSAGAFCGFYVGGAGAKLFNDATVVVLMREGTRTVLSMQNAYKGPPEKFAMVVPVPVVLQEENVKTLKRELFDHIDQLASPRLVEYWEQDPCAQQGQLKGNVMAGGAGRAAAQAAEAKAGPDLGVRIEAQFAVGEYQIVILSAQDSGGLDTWLHREGYNIPEGGEPYFRPYVASGSKFFVAKVDVTKVKMEDGTAQLSPIRFHYDSEEFKLPVRLGLINSSGTQDLIIHILGRGTRYEAANYPNVTIPTNFDVSEAASDKFGTFYTTLFDRTLEKNPKAVVTEYAWEPTSCDPCPGPPMNFGDLTTFGIDVLPSTLGQQQQKPFPLPNGGVQTPSSSPARGRGGPPGMFFNPYIGGQFVLTRLHVRYTKESLGEDITFKAATPIIGGREIMGADGKLEHGAQPSTINNFQARYAIRHGWAGPIDCKEPHRGVWGAKPGGSEFDKPPTKAAQKLGLAPHVKTELATFVKQDLPEIGFTKGSSSLTSSSAGAGVAPGGTTETAKKGCLGCAVTEADGSRSSAWLAALGVVTLAMRRAIFARKRNR
jgi:MYXO-CTERM domain-containing protein